MKQLFAFRDALSPGFRGSGCQIKSTKSNIFLKRSLKIRCMMKTTEKPPKKKPARRENEADLSQKKPASSQKPDASAPNRSATPSGNPSEEEVISNLTRPVTNQDEQDKITNTDGKDIPIADK